MNWHFLSKSNKSLNSYPRLWQSLNKVVYKNPNCIQKLDFLFPCHVIEFSWLVSLNVFLSEYIPLQKLYYIKTYSGNQLIWNCFYRNTAFTETNFRSRRIPSLLLLELFWIFQSFSADFRQFSGYSEAILVVKLLISPENSLNIPQ